MVEYTHVNLEAAIAVDEVDQVIVQWKWKGKDLGFLDNILFDVPACPTLLSARPPSLIGC